jgi:hypothetical protein
MANTNSISTFKNAFYGGTRPNRFKVSGLFPTGVAGADINDQTTFKIIATEIPESSIDVISVPYRGRPIVFAGDRKYAPWRITVYDDSDSNNLWQVFHKWLEAIDGSKNHLYGNLNQTDFSYKDHQKTFTLTQYNLNTDEGSGTQASQNLRVINVHNAWPLSVGPIELDMGSQNPQVTFAVQLAFDYITFGPNTITTQVST